MPRSDDAPKPIDWRAWLALAWVIVFGVLYGKTVVEARGGKLARAWASVSAKVPTGPEPIRR